MAPKSAPPPPIHLEGTTLEGGGQLLRIALGLSALTLKPITITSIRGKRSGGGGLKAQHLTSLQWLSQASSARLSGAGLKSREITFTPSQTQNPTSPASFLTERGGQVRITQNTPGSVNLVLQAILPYILFSGAEEPIRVSISGGTNVSNSPSCDYVKEVLIPVLENIGITKIVTQIHSRGWSQGGTRVGSVTYTVTPLKTYLPGFRLQERGSVQGLKAIVIAPRETERNFRDELEVMVEKCGSRIFGTDDSEARFEVEFENSYHEKRYYLLLVAVSSTGIRLGRDWLYDIAIRPGKVAPIASTMVRKMSRDLIIEIEHGGCVDEYMRDQLVVFQALAKGRSEVFGGTREGKEVEASLHAKTAMWVAKEVVGVAFEEDGACQGIAYKPRGSEHREGDDVIGEIVARTEALEVKG